jgi:hypothetical protein
LTGWENGILVNGVISADSQRLVSSFIAVEPNTTYTVRSQIDSAYFFANYDSTQTFINNTVVGTYSANTENTFTTGSNIHFLRLAIRKNPSVNITPEDYVDFLVQLEQGSTATDYITHSYTLNEVFRDGQLVVNPDFSTTGSWSGFSNSSISISNGLLTSTGLGTDIFSINTQNVASMNTLGVKYYVNSRLRTLSNLTTSLRLGMNGDNLSVTTQTSPIQNQWYNISGVNTRIFTQTLFRIDHTYSPAANSNGAVMQVDYAYLYNLTALGLESLTQSQLDYLFTVWQFNNANAVTARQFIQTANIDTVAYGGLSYREIFEDGQLLTNPDFDNGTNNWLETYLNSFTVTEGIATYLANAINGRIYQDFSYGNDKHYAVAKYKSTSNEVLLSMGFLSSGTSSHSGSGQFETISLLNTQTTQTADSARVIDRRSSGFDNVEIDFIYQYNLTSLFGAGNEPDKATMDTLYQEYITLKGGLS